MNANFQKLERLLVEYIIRRSKIDILEYRRKNSFTDKIAEIKYQLIDENVDRAKVFFVSLLAHPETAVRKAAASSLLVLKHEEKKAIQVLEKIAKENHHGSLEAELLIDAWRNNKLNNTRPETKRTNAKKLRKVKKEYLDEVELLLAGKKAYPCEVGWNEMKEKGRVEERYIDMDMAVGAMYGITDNGIDFSPNNEPPTKDEILAWLWIIHPEWAPEIRELANEKIRQAIDDYYKYS
jgi:hypothetical protein